MPKFKRICRINLKISPSLPVTFVDISSMHIHFGTEFYTTVKE